MTISYSEDRLVEQPAIALFAELGWGTASCYEEHLGRDAPPERLYRKPSPGDTDHRLPLPLAGEG